MELQGIVHKVFETVHISATFKKRAFVLEMTEVKGADTYTELVQFEFIQDNVDKLDGVKVGESVNVGFNLKGRKWTSPQGEEKFFNTLQAWMIRHVKEDLPKPQASPSKMAELPKQEAPTSTPPPVMGSVDDGDIPF